MYYSYILRSVKDQKFYYGSTQDIKKRLIKHNKGDVRATKFRRPLALHFYEEHESRSLPYQRELFYKSIEGYKYLKEKNIT